MVENQFFLASLKSLENSFLGLRLEGAFRIFRRPFLFITECGYKASLRPLQGWGGEPFFFL